VQCDICDVAALRRYVHATRPDVIINAAAYTDVDGAEGAPDLAMALNATGPALLAEAANASGALLLHYSSDYVFDGTLGRAYTETDATYPVNVYGRSKRAGDAAAAQAGRHLILRAGWLYSTQRRNFLKTMVARLSTRQRVAVVTDQIGAPTSAARLADVTAQLLVRYCHDRNQFPFGLYHVAAAGQTSWYGYACAIADYLGAAGMSLADGAVQPVLSADHLTAHPAAARRPPDTRLDATRLRDVFGIVLPPWQDDVVATLVCLLNPNSNPPCAS